MKGGAARSPLHIKGNQPSQPLLDMSMKDFTFALQ